jgi:hypothetical protein
VKTLNPTACAAVVDVKPAYGIVQGTATNVPSQICHAGLTSQTLNITLDGNYTLKVANWQTTRKWKLTET